MAESGFLTRAFNFFFILIGYIAVLVLPLVAIGLDLQSNTVAQTLPDAPAATCAWSWRAMSCLPADECRVRFLGFCKHR